MNILNILGQLFSEVKITSVVAEEFGEILPGCIVVDNPTDQTKINALKKILDAGEATSIALALEQYSTILIIDEKKGRKIALDYGLNVTGTIGLFLLAKQAGLISDLRSVIKNLEEKGFRLSQQLKETVIQLSGEN